MNRPSKYFLNDRKTLTGIEFLPDFLTYDNTDHFMIIGLEHGTGYEPLAYTIVPEDVSGAYIQGFPDLRVRFTQFLGQASEIGHDLVGRDLYLVAITDEDDIEVIADALLADGDVTFSLVPVPRED